MSTVFLKKEQKKETREDGRNTTGGAFQADREERCDLCRGELYPGDPYFELEGRIVCEYCLGRYAKGFFAAQLRHVGRGGRSYDTV